MGRAVGRAVDGALSGVVIAGAAHLVNLLDVAPGAAVACVVLIGAGGLPRAAPALAPVAAAAAIAPADLGERAMLGDTGAHALGAAPGVALTRGAGRRGRAVPAVGVVPAAAGGDRISRFARRASKLWRQGRAATRRPLSHP